LWKFTIIEISFMLGFNSDELFLARVLPSIPTEIHRRSHLPIPFRSNGNLKDIMNNVGYIDIRE
jgi:hypothetical protein